MSFFCCNSTVVIRMILYRVPANKDNVSRILTIREFPKRFVIFSYAVFLLLRESSVDPISFSSMTPEIAFVIGLLALAVCLFVLERIPPDHTSFLVLAVLLFAGSLPFRGSLPAPDDLLRVFGNPAPITIGAMFVISAALEASGALEGMSVLLRKISRLGLSTVIFLVTLCVGAVSAFMNNTPVVVIFVPVMLVLAREMKVPASKLLIPLSFASIFGGICTLVGTSTNILSSDILRKAGMQPINMFELTWVGLPLLLVGAIFMSLIGHRLLPRRDTLTSILSDEERREFITTAYIRKGSPLVGQTLKKAGGMLHGVRIMEIVRNEVTLDGSPTEVILKDGDRLVIAVRPSGLSKTRGQEGVDVGLEEGLGIETIAAHEGMIVEGVVAPRSSLIGLTLGGINFRQRYRMIVLAIHRRGINLRQGFENVPLAFGDALLMMGTDEAREALRRSDDILLLDRPATPSRPRPGRILIVLATLLGVVTVASLNLLPIVVAALIGCGILMGTGCIKPKQAYASIDWGILILIYGMLALGMAMEDSGAAQMFADRIMSVTEGFAPHTRVMLVLAGAYLITSVMTEVMSNNASVVIMAPIAIDLALLLGVDPRPFVIAVTVAASASFSTPIGYQTNTYVFGVGNYHFGDFIRVGLPLNLVYFAATMLIVPFVWPLKFV